MADCNQTAPAGEAETYGWDTVYATKYADVNAAIAAEGSSPPSFSYTSSDGDTSVSGDFGDWRVATGGSGPDIQMELPLTNVRVQITSQNIDDQIDSITAKIQVSAEFLPQPDQTQHLKLKTKTSAPGAADEDVVRFESFDPTPSNVFVAGALELGLVTEWLCNNLEDFNHTFAVVDLNQKIDKDGWEWMRPTDISYAVGEPDTDATDENSVFAVLVMTEDRSSANLDQQVSPYAIPPDSRAGFLVSGNRYIQKMILPGVPVLFKDSPTVDDFDVEDGLRIVNINEQKFEDITLKDGSKVNPKVAARNFSIEVSGDELVLSAAPYEFSHSNADWSLTYTARSTLCYDPDTDIVTSNSTPSVSGEVHMKEWVQIVSAIAAAIVEIAIAVVGFALGGGFGSDAAEAIEEGAEEGSTSVEMSEETAEESENTMDNEEESQGAAWQRKLLGVVGGSLIGLLPGGVIAAASEIAEKIKDGQTDDLPTTTPFTDVATGSITWPSGSGFTLESVQLNGSLQFGGTPETTDS